jgi:hypothetical protein
MLREIVQVKNENYNLKIPKEYLNKKVEILVFGINDKKNYNASEILNKSAGILKNKNIDPVKWQREIRDDR